MCTHANPNTILVQINDNKYTFPVCHVVCCDMEKLDLEDLFSRLTQPVQTMFQAKQLEMNVKDLTTRVAGLTKVIEKPQTKKIA